MPKVTQLVSGKARNPSQSAWLIGTTLLYHEREMSCSRKLEKKEKLLAEPMKKSFRFSWAYKDQYSLYIEAFEANPMDFTLRFYSTNLSPFFSFLSVNYHA